MKRERSTLSRSGLAVAVLLFAAAAVVVIAAVLQAVREDSWGPIWTIGWLPAVLVGGLYRPATRCRPPFRGRSQA